MAHTKTGTQTIGCNVKSCRYNADGNYCELNRIQVEPMEGTKSCHTGRPGDESLCGSYMAR
ncbi:MAG: DUF1540 domain-containing protein [Clostridiales bacterium]|jgi:hypothetical protein|nr:DUF1540 domain-containing protein [Clostridiales bacterium]